MRSLAPAMTLGVVGVVTPIADAQHTRITIEASTDPAAGWANEVTVAPGATVFVRVRVRLKGATALGLAGLAYQPTLSNWTASDERVPFTFPGLDGAGGALTETSYNASQVRSTPETNTGRLFPFGASGQGSTSASGLLTSFVDGGNTLRFSGSKNTAPTVNLAWGVQSVQLTPLLAGKNFHFGVDALVFRYAVRLGDQSGARDLVATLPPTHINLGRSSLYICYNCLAVLNAPVGHVDSATIHLVPGPGAVAAWGVVALACTGRRRPKCELSTAAPSAPARNGPPGRVP